MPESEQRTKRFAEGPLESRDSRPAENRRLTWIFVCLIRTGCYSELTFDDELELLFLILAQLDTPPRAVLG